MVLDKVLVGSRMKEKRLSKEMTQVVLSAKCGISARYYSSIENGRNSPSLEVLEKIAAAIDVSLLYLLNDRIDEMEKRVLEEESRLNSLFETIPKNEKELAEGLITQAARLRVLLDDNWKDILENGEYEKFSQSENQIPYDRRRPIAENYDIRDKTYQSIINQLSEMLPESKRKNEGKSPLLRRR